jgi:hypothetical protein
MNVEEVIDRYCEAWCDPDAGGRAALLAKVWSERATYTDPTVHAEGASELLAHIARVQARRPGGRVLRTSVIDGHHDVVRFAWKAVDANGATLVNGIDLAILTSDGTKIERIVGFFGDLQPLAGA